MSDAKGRHEYDEEDEEEENNHHNNHHHNPTNATERIHSRCDRSEVEKVNHAGDKATKEEDDEGGPFQEAQQHKNNKNNNNSNELDKKKSCEIMDSKPNGTESSEEKHHSNNNNAPDPGGSRLASNSYSSSQSSSSSSSPSLVTVEVREEGDDSDCTNKNNAAPAATEEDSKEEEDSEEEEENSGVFVLRFDESIDDDDDVSDLIVGGLTTAATDDEEQAPAAAHADPVMERAGSSGSNDTSTGTRPATERGGGVLRSSSNSSVDSFERRHLRHRRRQRRQGVLTFLCIPCMFLTTLIMLIMMMIFMGLPFCMFLLCLLSAYYCCTSDPLPPRVLLRALLDTDDWHGGTVHAGHFHRRFTSKREIEKELIQRVCLGTVHHRAAQSQQQQQPDIGQNLQSVERRHHGRVHWRCEQDVGWGNTATKGTATEPGQDEEFECVVFSAPLADTNKEEIDQQLKEFEKLQSQNTLTAHNNNKSKNDVDIESGLSSGNNDDDEAEKVGPEHDDVDNTSVRERGTSCDICLIHFELGDVIAWSTNQECSHAYHSDCISDWLMRQPTCPSCRHEYLPPIRGEDDESSRHDSNDDDHDDDDDNDNDNDERPDVESVGRRPGIESLARRLQSLQMDNDERPNVGVGSVVPRMQMDDVHEEEDDDDEFDNSYDYEDDDDDNHEFHTVNLERRDNEVPTATPHVDEERPVTRAAATNTTQMCYTIELADNPYVFELEKGNTSDFDDDDDDVPS